MASGKASKFQQYAASKVENHPDNNFNGDMTAEYFATNFGLNGREGLALMGAHSIGAFHMLFSRFPYVWINNPVRLNISRYYEI